VGLLTMLNLPRDGVLEKANSDAATPQPKFHRKSAATFCREPKFVR